MKLLAQVKTVLPGSDGASARLYFATLAWQAGAPDAAKAELERIEKDGQTPAAVRAIAALRLHQLGGHGDSPEAGALDAFPTHATAWAAEAAR